MTHDSIASSGEKQCGITSVSGRGKGGARSPPSSGISCAPSNAGKSIRTTGENMNSPSFLSIASARW